MPAAVGSSRSKPIVRRDHSARKDACLRRGHKVTGTGPRMSGCRRLRRPGERRPPQDEKSDAREPGHRMPHQEPGRQMVQSADHRDLVVVAVAEEPGVLLDVIAQLLKPPYLRRVRSTTPAIVRGEFAILDRIAGAEELLRESTDTLGE